MSIFATLNIHQDDDADADNIYDIRLNISRSNSSPLLLHFTHKSLYDASLDHFEGKRGKKQHFSAFKDILPPSPVYRVFQFAFSFHFSFSRPRYSIRAEGEKKFINFKTFFRSALKFSTLVSPVANWKFPTVFLFCHRLSITISQSNWLIPFTLCDSGSMRRRTTSVEKGWKLLKSYQLG